MPPEVRRILDSLGFDFIADAAAAIRTDPEWDRRWDLTEDEKRTLARWLYGTA